MLDIDAYHPAIGAEGKMQELMSLRGAALTSSACASSPSHSRAQGTNGIPHPIFALSSIAASRESRIKGGQGES
jgi:hypothetical protein